MKARRLVWLCGAAILLLYGTIEAKVALIDRYAEAVTTADAPVLEKLLAPSFWYIGSNGHIRDKENFIREIQDKTLVVDRLALSNERETKVGDTRLITANGTFKAQSALPRPQGLMRFTVVLVNNNGQEQVALFQATPVVASEECPDGNCKIK